MGLAHGVRVMYAQNKQSGGLLRLIPQDLGDRANGLVDRLFTL